MTTDRVGTGGRLTVLAALIVLGLGLAALCVRTTLSQILPAQGASSLRFASHDANEALTRATDAIVRQHGHLSTATLDEVRRAAAAAPLDSRAFLILGHQQLLDREPARATRTLEAGERLDPRQTLIHLLLLDRYLRTGRYGEVATQMAVLGRLIGQTQPAIAAAVARMSLAPETRDAARRAMAGDPALERSVLIALAGTDTPPEAIFAFATPAARATAGGKESWGPVLVGHLVEQRRFLLARDVWRRLYRLGDTAAIFNPGFRPSRASAPFNWTLTAGSIGAADMRAGGLAVEYYGRDSGDVAAQLLVLPPGRYRFAVTVDPGRTDGASKLIWSLGCGVGDTSLMNLVMAAGSATRRLTADLSIPAGCPAQRLTLRGEAGEFPAPSAVTVRDPAIQPLGKPGR